jgi:hypothetical protein
VTIDWAGRERALRRLSFKEGRKITCDRCKAKPGEPCITANGNKASMDHAARFYAGSELAIDALARVTRKKR